MPGGTVSPCVTRIPVKAIVRAQHVLRCFMQRGAGHGRSASLLQGGPGNQEQSRARKCISVSPAGKRDYFCNRE